MAFVFVSSYMLWPYTLSGFSVVNFGIWLGVVTLLMALAVYDARWMLLPNRLVYPLSALVAVLVVGLAVAQQNPGMIFGSFAGAALLSGIFYLLFQLSSGRWIGGGDVRLAVALGALSGGMIASILVLFIASLLGSIVGIPMMAKHRSHRHILPFGPFLIMATFIVFLFGSNIIAAYNSLVGI
jgi:prepilin signal peptidase PulO-like enzyme (type II secretory pathway)